MINENVLKFATKLTPPSHRGQPQHDQEQLQAELVFDAGSRICQNAGAVADYGLALVEAGHHADGINCLERAWATFDAIGFRSEATRIQQALYRAGVHKSRRPAGDRPATGWGSLTPSESTVAHLVAEGHTNRTAAQTLGISVNTVGTHLNSVFAKLAVRSRLQLSHAVRNANQDLRHRKSDTVQHPVRPAGPRS